MTKKLSVLILITFCLLMGSACRKHVYAKNIDQVFPDAIGKWKIVNYWADWCQSCVYEIPELNAFYQRYKGKAIIYGVYYNPIAKTSLLSLQRKFKIIYPILHENVIKPLTLGDVNAIPTTIVINPKGEIIARLRGPQTLSSLESVIKP